MREILFRGKRIDNGEWVEGYYIPIEERAHIVLEADTMCMDAECADFFAVEWYQVDPETVCQYTGLTDKNGVKIFEGDVVAFTRVNALGWNTHRVGEVRYYDELPIFYIMASTGDAWDWVDCENIEVIGNIFDNPELMEGGVADD